VQPTNLGALPDMPDGLPGILAVNDGAGVRRSHIAIVLAPISDQRWASLTGTPRGTMISLFDTEHPHRPLTDYLTLPPDELVLLLPDWLLKPGEGVDSLDEQQLRRIVSRYAKDLAASDAESAKRAARALARILKHFTLDDATLGRMDDQGRLTWEGAVVAGTTVPDTVLHGSDDAWSAAQVPEPGGLFTVVAATAWLTSRRSRRQGKSRHGHRIAG
jgi:hypothetical protein